MSIFLYMIAMTQLLRKLSEAALTGFTEEKRIPVDFIKNFSVDIPPIYEQKVVLKQLSEVIHKLDVQLEYCNKTISAPEELRPHLISDIVIKEFYVCGIKIPNFEYYIEETDSSNDADKKQRRKNNV